MLQTAGWLARVTAVVVVGLGTFLHSPVTPPVLAAQAAAFVVGVVALGIWALIDFGVPPMAGHTRVALAVLALLAATGGVCDQASVREGLVVLLDLLPDIDVVASAASGQEALDLADEHHPDAILLDLHMPVMDGTEAARLLTARHPDIAIVVLTTYADDTSILAALRAGARSYLTKDADRSTIAQALRGAASGLSVLAPSAHATLLTAAAAAAAAAPPPSPAGPTGELPAGLTPREAEILTMIGRGMTNAEIAQTLVLSNHTIKTHINRVFAKTGSANRTEASRFARAHGLT